MGLVHPAFIFQKKKAGCTRLIDGNPMDGF
jgi:hypothetical protein